MIEMQETQLDAVLKPDKAISRKRTRQIDWSNWLIWISAFALAAVVSRNGWEAFQQHERSRAVRCDLPVFDFGEGFVGDVIDHSFHVINVSRTSLEIGKIQVSCGCTTVANELEGTVIGPGEAFDGPVFSVPLMFALLENRHCISNCGSRAVSQIAGAGLKRQ